MFGIVWLDFDFKAMSKYDARLKEWYERTNGGKLDEVSGTKLHIVEHGVGAKKGEEATASKGSVSRPCDTDSPAHHLLHDGHGIFRRIL